MDPLDGTKEFSEGNHCGIKLQRPTFITHHRCNRVCYSAGGDSSPWCARRRRHPPTILEARRHASVPASCGKDSLGTGGRLRGEGPPTPDNCTPHGPGPHCCGDHVSLLQPHRHVRQVHLPLHPPQGRGRWVQSPDGHRGTR